MDIANYLINISIVIDSSHKSALRIVANLLLHSRSPRTFYVRSSSEKVTELKTAKRCFENDVLHVKVESFIEAPLIKIVNCL